MLSLLLISLSKPGLYSGDHHGMKVEPLLHVCGIAHCFDTKYKGNFIVGSLNYKETRQSFPNVDLCTHHHEYDHHHINIQY